MLVSIEVNFGHLKNLALLATELFRVQVECGNWEVTIEQGR